MFYRLGFWTKWCFECGTGNIESVLANLWWVKNLLKNLGPVQMYYQIYPLV